MTELNDRLKQKLLQLLGNDENLLTELEQRVDNDGFYDALRQIERIKNRQARAKRARQQKMHSYGIKRDVMSTVNAFELNTQKQLPRTPDFMKLGAALRDKKAGYSLTVPQQNEIANGAKYFGCSVDDLQMFLTQ